MYASVCCVCMCMHRHSLTCVFSSLPVQHGECEHVCVSVYMRESVLCIYAKALFKSFCSLLLSTCALARILGSLSVDAYMHRDGMGLSPHWGSKAPGGAISKVWVENFGENRVVPGFLKPRGDMHRDWLIPGGSQSSTYVCAGMARIHM